MDAIPCVVHAFMLLARAGLEGRLFVAELVLAARILLVSVCLGRGCFVGMQHSL